MHVQAARRTAIYARDLSVTAPGGTQTLLRGISLEVPEGSFVGVIGASGCGKSTLLRTLCGLQPAASGRVLLAGHSVRELKSAFPLAVGYLPQFGAFHPELTVAEVLEYGAALRLPRSVDQQVRKQWITHLIEFSGLQGILGQRHKTLSGGEMRRIALAEMLIGDPTFLFLDELTSGLDAYSDQEMMIWLRDLAHQLAKTVVLVTHATANLHCCDSVAFLHQGRLVYHGDYAYLLESHAARSVEELFCQYHGGGEVLPVTIVAPELGGAPEAQPLKTARPPRGFRQIFTLAARQTKLLLRDKGQLILQLALLVTFPCLVAVFATGGLPQVRNLSLAIEQNPIHTLTEQLAYLKESFTAASLVSGLAMFQVILLSLIGANNGAREIAKERDILNKELQAGLSPWAYVLTKIGLVFVFSVLQAFWMTGFVKVVCGFPGSFALQFAVLFATTLAMSVTCLAISAASRSPERASLLAIYLVGLQLPLSGAVLALPVALSWVCRPFIAAYWGWSGYLKTLEASRNYDIVKQSTDTYIASIQMAVTVLALHVVVCAVLAFLFVRRQRNNL